MISIIVELSLRLCLLTLSDWLLIALKELQLSIWAQRVFEGKLN